MARRTALLSVSDRRGLEALGRRLRETGWKILATPGTRAALADAGVEADEIASEVGGRLKTLRAEILAGILARHADEANGADLIDLVAVNFYRDGEVDVGGVTLARAAAKNCERVTVLSSPDDYAEVLPHLAGEIPSALRAAFAGRTFLRTAAYDARLAAERLGDLGATPPALRYGENPGQAAAAVPAGEPGLLEAERLHGGALSYNNLLDLDAAARAARAIAPFGQAAVFVKHRTPCGAAAGPNLAEAIRAARAADETSAYGGVFASSAPLDEAAAEALSGLFLECVLAPGFDEAARARLGRRKKGRVLAWPALLDPPPAWEARTVQGALLVQALPRAVGGAPRAVEKLRAATPEEARARDFAAALVEVVPSNAVVLADAFCADPARGHVVAAGVGGGAPSRRGAAAIAARAAGARPDGAARAAASDAFFPFPDGLEILIEAGATAIAAPVGSVRDGEVLAAAARAGVAFAALERRAFRH